MTTLYAEMINLARADARRALMIPTLAAAGVSVEVFPAFDLRAGDTAALDEGTRPFGNWGVFKGQDRAVTISHARVWERFLDTNADLCLVLEDDVFLSPELGTWLSDLSWWPDGADLIKIERWQSKSLKLLMRPHATHLGRQINQLLSRHTGAAGYILTRRAAKKFLAQRPFSMTVDQLLFNLNASPAARRMAVYQVTPALVVQGNEPASDGTSYVGRERPSGWPLVRQKLQRGYFELAYPLSTIFALLTGKAGLDTVPYAETTLIPHPQSGCA
ncbi:MAG: glycosyltransferase family 25 protein [Tateyamaria sp.]